MKDTFQWMIFGLTYPDIAFWTMAPGSDLFDLKHRIIMPLSLVPLLQPTYWDIHQQFVFFCTNMALQHNYNILPQGI